MNRLFRIITAYFNHLIKNTGLISVLLLPAALYAVPFQGITQTIQIATKGSVHDIVLFNNEQYALVASGQEGVLLFDST